ncbi:MAG: hypothetical protein C5B45_06315 [Chlamydiae bacterium]|nr:MAG: hypothetical protein C5B45_06315 [Chlamydiota bacterium]
MYNDPMNILGKFKFKTHATNFCGWENAEYTQLLDRSFYEEGKERLQTLEQAEKIFLSEMPFIPLYHEDSIYITNPRLPFTIPLWCSDRMLIPLKNTK